MCGREARARGASQGLLIPFCLFRGSECEWRSVPAACCALLLACRSLLPGIPLLLLYVRCIPLLPLAHRSLLPTATCRCCLPLLLAAKIPREVVTEGGR